MYLIIGWNRLVRSLVPLLKKKEEDVFLFPPGEDVDLSTESIDLPEDHLISDILEVQRKVKSRSKGTVLLLCEDTGRNIGYASDLKSSKGSFHFLALVDGEEKKKKRSSNNSIEMMDALISRNESAIDTLLDEIENLNKKARSKKLVEALGREPENVSIFLHNNPDPDAIASAMALEEICEEKGLPCSTYYGGEIGHPENELIMESTDFAMESIASEDVEEILSSTGTIVFLDFAQASVNNLLPEEIEPDIIIDHHFTNKELEEGNHVEIRTDVGASSTILTQHLQNLKIDISPLLAAVLLYGIKVDTDDYTKNIYPSDFSAISYLQSLADEELLDIFESPPLKPNTINALGRAISNRRFEGGILTAWIGKVAERDDIPQVANILMRERDVMTVLAYGSLGEKIYMSARCKDVETNIGKKMKDAFSDIGEGGGHKHSAGGSVPLERFEKIEEAVQEIEERFVEEVIG